MSRYWGENVIIDGSTIRQQFEDPLPTMGPPRIVTNDSSNPKAAAFEFAAQEVIRKIAGTTVGAILVRGVNSLRFVVTLRPVNEMAIGLTSTVPSDPAAARRGGAGSNVTIWYDPFTWGDTSTKRGIDIGNHYQPDDVLFHELVHALRALRGLMDPVQIRGWDNIEDLFAIMLTNIYLSSNNRNRDLRGDHGMVFSVLPNSPLRPKEQVDEQSFYTQFSTDIDRLCGSMPDLCLPISQIQCRWNPLRARVNNLNSPTVKAFQQVTVKGR